ncbi:MAG: long-chain fatty acid--CoA ligase [Lyngbya sp.]|nr:long-chain fatty acid--CoA ligase [Lyngbya sp.]
MTSTIITHWLLDRLSSFKEEPALIWNEQQYSYQNILEGVNRWQNQLKKSGIKPGDCVALYGDYSPNICMLLVALLINRNIAVPLTTSVADKKEKFLNTAQATALFDFDNNDNWHLTKRETTDAHPLLHQLQSAGEPGLILFTSGSTGESKALLLNFNKLIANFEKPRPKFRSLTFLLLDHIGGINTLFYIFSSGGTAISIDERSPKAICQAIERYRVQLLPTTPTFLNMLLISEAYKRYDLSSLELITYGTEPMPASTLYNLNKTFPNVKFKQTYGLSELGIPKTQSRDSNSLWIKISGAGFETKIVDKVLWVRSESAMLGYLNAPSPFDKDGWFNTGDAVEVDGEYIRILGRTSEIINVGGEKVYPAEVESVLREMDNIKEVAVRGKSNPVIGNVVVATVNLVEPEDPQKLNLRMREFCKDKLAPFKIPMVLKVSEEKLYSGRFKKMRKGA